MANPAEPILASAVWTAHRTLEAGEDPENARRRERLTSGCRAVDEALGGGLEYGSISGINADANSGAQELCEAFLVSHLLSSPDATATVIDTAHSFDVRKLHRSITSEMQDSASGAEVALEVLDRLKIMKVFDFIGLTESVSELRDPLECKQSSSAQSNPQEKAPKASIGDSEDEDEMLDIPSPPPKPPQPLPQNQKHQPTYHHSILLIDNITHVVAPLMKNHYTQGQAVLASFMRSLGHLTRTHNLCTILLNGVTSGANIKDEPPSIFSSCMLHPALRKPFAHTIDTNLLVHQVSETNGMKPRSHSRAEDQAQPEVGSMVSVIEVMQDRNGNSLGRWAPFTLSESGRLVATA